MSRKIQTSFLIASVVTFNKTNSYLHLTNEVIRDFSS
jgi:hypothetical protein